MYLGLPIPAWLYFCYNQRWYAAPILMLLITTRYTAFIEDVMVATCNIPEYPTISSSFICYFVRARANVMGHNGVPSPSKIDTQQDVLVRSFFSQDIITAALSIGDVIFLVESSQLNHHEAIAGAVKYLQDESIILTADLLGLRAETSHHFGL